MFRITKSNQQSQITTWKRISNSTKFGIYEIIEGRKSEKKIIVINIAVKVEGKIKKN